MRKVLDTSTAQPAAYSAHSATRGQAPRPTTPWRAAAATATAAVPPARLEARTKVLRSTAAGTHRVHRRLNQGRAITLCWTANRPSSPASTSTAAQDRAGRAVVDALGHADAGQEADRVSESDQEGQA